MTNNLPKVAIVGRVNVGKSTLFNRLVGKRLAVVSPIPGTTRDRRYGICDWRGKEIILIDTGGYIDKILLGKKKIKQIKTFTEEEKIDKKVVEHTKAALEEADLVLFLTDLETGITVEDRKVATVLKKLGKETILGANKADKPIEVFEAVEFQKLGFGEPIAVSAALGRGTGDLLDSIFNSLGKKLKPAEEIAEKINIAIVGKPNVGKSSLLNSILGYEKAIVSPIPHTTRESQGETVEFNGQNYFFIDTAGIRKQAMIKRGVELAGVLQAKESMRQADVVLFIIDSAERLSVQDSKIGALLDEAGAGVIIVMNKWDLIPDHSSENQKKFLKYIYSYFPHLKWAPIVFLSAKTGFKVHKIYELILEVKKEREKTIEQGSLDKFLSKVVKMNRPAKGGGAQRPYIYKMEQAGTRPPTFNLKVSAKGELADFYLNYVENRLREKFGFLGSPIRLKVVYVGKKQ